MKPRSCSIISWDGGGRAARAALAAALAVALAGCDGMLDAGPSGARGVPRGEGPTSTPPPDDRVPEGRFPVGTLPEDAVDDVAPAPMRRLANDELGNAIETLTGIRPPSLSMLPGDVSDARSLFFPGLAGRQPLARVETWLAIADEAAEGISETRILALAPGCASSADRACASSFATALGERAFRRPVADVELAAILGLYDAAGDPAEGLRQIVRFVISSAPFLYVVERGTATPERPDLIALDDRAISTRLALALTDDLPDAELLAAADSGALGAPEGIRAEASRLLGTERARRTVERFFDHWLGLDHIASLERDPAAFPDLDDALAASMLAETHTFLAYEVFEASAPLAELFRADFSFVDRRLGALYGIDVASDSPVRVALPPERRGILTHASVLAHDQGATFTRPIQRAVYVLRRLLCVDLEPPPDDVDASPRASEPGATTRETYERLTSAGTCGGCHSVLNPAGFAFEDFDAIGAHRTTERGVAVDASGSIGVIEVEGLNGGASVGAAIADTDAIHTCFARQWLRYTLGRVETVADTTSIRAMSEASRGGAPLRDVMLSVVETYAFRHRALPAE
jgi:hypothetical protein